MVKIEKKFVKKIRCECVRIKGDSGSLFSHMIFGSCLPERLISFFLFSICVTLSKSVSFTLYLEYKTGFSKGKKSGRKKRKILQIFPCRLQPVIWLEDMNKIFEQIDGKTIIMFLLSGQAPL